MRQVMEAVERPQVVHVDMHDCLKLALSNLREALLENTEALRV